MAVAPVLAQEVAGPPQLADRIVRPSENPQPGEEDPAGAVRRLDAATQDPDDRIDIGAVEAGTAPEWRPPLGFSCGFAPQ